MACLCETLNLAGGFVGDESTGDTDHTAAVLNVLYSEGEAIHKVPNL